MALVRYGGLAAIGYPDPFKAPWWIVIVVQIWTRIQSIHEAAGYDPEKMTAPRDLWLNTKELESWYNDRERLRNERQALPNY